MNYLTAQFKKDLTSRKGFTLIELMVVIAIIAILAVIAATVYGNIQGRGRDATRQADVDAVATALEAAKTNGNSSTYPALAITQFVSGALPVDPSGDADSYCISHSQTVGNATAALPIIANWAATVACPTLPAAGGGNTAYVAIAPGTPPALTTAFRVCTRLEVAQTIYCKGNQQ